ncbi:HlyD family secretion protein [Paracrocinitomix mangrovi]|uniref:HlyD family secretion protein n=1 Tax=Paracrocinitomix mangrovi TaxID=2862509 RepID=UPI001C8E535E|nr:HlyD family secretion protein [Paracrocinitomix mangrovi]UKN02810.1 HlyD family secretion protein [Paracrocinitomix mangrovi]
MKSVNFKRKEESYLRYFEEQSARKSKRSFNWDRFVYLVLLALFLFFTGRFIVNSYFYIEGNGQVLFESVDIRHTDDIRILEFMVKEGDDVEIGDTLFTYFLDEDYFGDGGGSNSVSIAGGGNKDSWIEREIYNLKKSIDLNTVRIKDEQELLQVYKDDRERVRNEVILDAVSHTNLENLDYQIAKLESDINLLNSQNSIYRRQIGHLKDMLEDEVEQQKIEIMQRTGATGFDDNGQPIFSNLPGKEMVMLAGVENIQGYKIFTSPINGNVTRIHKMAFEVALKTENILSIHQPNNVHIKGFFSQEDLRYLHEGDIVNVEFADGTESQGIVDRFYSATYILPEEFQKKFEPTTRTLAADILPIGKNDLDMWKKYYKLSVKITKRTF